MKRSGLLVLLVLALVQPQIHANGPNQAWDRSLRIETRETLGDFTIFLSEVRLVVPFSMFLSQGALARLDLSTWYEAYSPYLDPSIFFEAGLVASFVIVDSSWLRVQPGVGTAIARGPEGISIPMIFETQVNVYPFHWLEVRSLVRGYLYVEGILGQGDLAVAFKPFPWPILRGLYLGGGAGINLGYSWGIERFQWTPNGMFFLGYLF